MQGRICMTCLNREKVIVTDKNLKVLDSPLLFFYFSDTKMRKNVL